MPLPLSPTAAAKLQAELANAWHAVADVTPPEEMIVEARTPGPYDDWYMGLAVRRGDRWFTVQTNTEFWPTHWREVR